MLLIVAFVFAGMTQGTNAERSKTNNPSGKSLKPQVVQVQSSHHKPLIHRGLASWTKKTEDKEPIAVEIGEAGWYGGKFHGRRTKYGDVFDMNKVSFAHNTLPKDSFIRVTNLNNGLSVEGLVNDTGAFGKKYDRIADLSREAMRRIGGLHKGVVPIKIEVLYLPKKSVNRSS